MEHGYIKRESNNRKKKTYVRDIQLLLPIKPERTCKYCKYPRIDLEIRQTFDLNVCNECKFTHLRLINKTSAMNEYLLTNEDLKNIKHLTKPNPKKGTWCDMQLFLLDEVEEIGIKKHGSLKNIEIEKEKKNEILMERKKKKIKAKIRELRKRTIIEKKIKYQKHQHSFVFKDGTSVCEGCGMKIQQEEI